MRPGGAVWWIGIRRSLSLSAGMLSLFDGGASEADAYAVRTPADRDRASSRCHGPTYRPTAESSTVADPRAPTPAVFDAGLVLREKHNVHPNFQKQIKINCPCLEYMCVQIERRKFPQLSFTMTQV
jgi:hypothetical protein